MIGQQRLGRFSDITPTVGRPDGNEANRLVMAGTWDAQLLPTCWLIGVWFVGTSPPAAVDVNLYLWGRDNLLDAGAGRWGRLGLNDGNLNGASAFEPDTVTDSWWFILQNLEIWQDLYLEQLNTTGAPTVTAALAPMYEQAVELRGL
jgi:hypothetical protein